MIVYDLCCSPNAHRFEGWFGSSDDFAAQQARGLVTCPICGSAEVTRAVSAPNLGRKANQRPDRAPKNLPAAPAPAQAANVPLPPEAIAALRTIAQMQAEALKSSTWVGNKFTDQARAMHYGETDPAPIHGQATPEEARALVEEGVEIAPILFPVAPPGKAN
ncbi:DUF1178 family protein [Novosphingobium sp. FSW06-99]|uniref:DUF1178 family protein n=1 Tax=Novosphingobium sp. FSW06-99 TaxID=1739113 RepID=UPI00076BD0EF|nr:DUF1178 family protein [Novosphingobium sp. FSW06-99]KUR77011.1 hypothetical protein AQZ49_10775 [Novosphingobium sp. FSW06-99]